MRRILAVLAIGAMAISTTFGAIVPRSTVPRVAVAVDSLEVTGLSLPTRIDHVVLVMEENKGLNWTLSDPTFKSLFVSNAHADHLYATCHPSAPNYIAVVAATVHQCGSDNLTYYSDSNLASNLSRNGRSWQGLFESMPSPCDRHDSYPYVAHHNPWLFFSNLKSSCAAHDLPLNLSNGTSRFRQELHNGTLPAFVFIAPNMMNDSHDGSLARASAWLKSQVLGPVLASTSYSNRTVVLVLFDEAFRKSCNCPEPGGYTADGVKIVGGPVYLVAVSPISTSTDVISSNASDFSVVSTVEWVLGLAPLGHHDNSSFPALSGLFNWVPP